MRQRENIAFIGGTGPEGLGLALRFAAAGRSVAIGSRSDERAQEAVAKIRAALPNASVQGLSNLRAAGSAEIIVITVPYDAQAETLKGLREAAAMELAACIKGCRGVDGGGLVNARHVEAFTAVLLSINRMYKTRASLRLTGV